jgi:predicted acyltransferase
MVTGIGEKTEGSFTPAKASFGKEASRILTIVGVALLILGCALMIKGPIGKVYWTPERCAGIALVPVGLITAFFCQLNYLLMDEADRQMARNQVGRVGIIQ